MKRNQKTLQSKVSAIFRNKIEQPIAEFTEEFSKEAKEIADGMAESKRLFLKAKEPADNVQKMREKITHTVRNILDNAHKPSKEKISDRELLAVISENIKKLQERNGALDDFTKEEPFLISIDTQPQKLEQKSWQYSDSNRFCEDYINNSTYWREADAIYNAYAHQLANQDDIDRYDLQLTLQMFYLQQDAIEEHLDLLCRLIKNMTVRYEYFDKLELPVSMPISVYKISESILTQLKSVRKNLEMQLYANYEQMCLIGKALAVMEDEDETELIWKIEECKKE